MLKIHLQIETKIIQLVNIIIIIITHRAQIKKKIEFYKKKKYLLIGKTDENCDCSFGIFECERKSQIRCVCLKKAHYIMITASFRIFFFF